MPFRVFVFRQALLYLNMRKSGVFSSALFLSIIIAGVYGILHDQVTASLSPEYYTKFKFLQFRINPDMPFRQGVAFVGFYATWWMGAEIGLVLATLALIFPDHQSMKLALLKAFAWVLSAVVSFGLLGYGYGRSIAANPPAGWWIPGEVVHKADFVTVGAIHNAGYIGGLLGLLAAIVMLCVRRWRQRKLK